MEECISRESYTRGRAIHRGRQERRKNPCRHAGHLYGSGKDTFSYPPDDYILKAYIIIDRVAAFPGSKVAVSRELHKDSTGKSGLISALQLDDFNLVVGPTMSPFSQHGK